MARGASPWYYTVFAGTAVFRDAFDPSGVSVGPVITALTPGYDVPAPARGRHRPVRRAADAHGRPGWLAVGVALVAVAPTYGLPLDATSPLGVGPVAAVALAAR